MAQTDIATLTATEDAIAASLDAMGLHPADVLERIALADCRKLQGRLVDPAAMPPAAEALAMLRDEVIAEERHDLTGDLAGLFMHQTGDLQLGGRAADPIIRRALCQLSQRLPLHPAYAGPYWSSIPAARRAVEFNATVGDNKRRNRGQYQITLRLRRRAGDAAHHIFAAVSDRFEPRDPDQLCTRLLEALGEHAQEVLCETNYWGWRTEIRLQLVDRGGYGVLALVTTSDDGSASTGITAELRLPSGATYSGSLGKSRRYRHIGGDVTTAQIKAALDDIDMICAPWVELWQVAAGRQLPVSLYDAINNLVGNVEGASARYAHLKVKGWEPGEIASALFGVLRKAENGELAGFKASPTQAGLAELLLVAARLIGEGERASALQAFGQALLNAPHATVARWVSAPQVKRNGVHVENEAAEARLAELVNANRQRWEDVADEAAAAGDEHGAKVARERAAIKGVEGDLLLSGGVSRTSDQPAPSTSKPFEF